MKVILFYKCSNFYVDFKKKKNLQKMLMLLKIHAFELLVGVSVNYEKNTCDRTLTC